MPFASFNPTNPRTHLKKFHEKILRIGDCEKWAFFESAILNFCFIPLKISPNLYDRMDGSKFWCFPWFLENSSLCVILCYTVYIDSKIRYLCTYRLDAYKCLFWSGRFLCHLIIDLWPILESSCQFLKFYVNNCTKKLLIPEKRWPISLKTGWFRVINQRSRPLQNCHFLPSKRYVLDFSYKFIKFSGMSIFTI